MQNKLLLTLFFLVFGGKALAQDTNGVVTDSVAIDTIDVVLEQNPITNTSSINLFFEKMFLLEQQKAGKVNIVHIGDSHIQADMFTGVIRNTLQKRFGNAGRGFTFPHSLANTNGSSFVRYKSNISWQSRRNVSQPNGMPVGLSGIALSSARSFAVELNIKDSAYAFNTIKIVTPGNEPMFDVAISSKTIILESSVPKKITHKIKSGEVLGSIADKYGVSVTAIKKLNGLKSNNIRAGRSLKIPTNEKEQREIKRSEFIPLDLIADVNTHIYRSAELLSKIYLIPNKNAQKYDLSGLILEKDEAGVLYHNIGVNGAKASDYNKYPLFFEQLPALQPDLVVISLGTNESFDKMSAALYLQQLNLLIKNIRAKSPDTAILVITPPPSNFQKKYPNTFAADYAKHIQMQEMEGSYASWDLYSSLGGLFNVNRNFSNGLMAGDRVHYSKAGYEKQGELFADALLNAYENFKINKN